MIAVIMFLNGMAVMVLEMAGARLLAPWLGTSVVVWTSLIGVILASLSLGYWTGGRLADRTLAASATKDDGSRKASEQRARLAHAHGLLSRLLVLGALLVLGTAFLQAPVLQFLAAGISSLHAATVLAALLLFAGPSLVCGMVSPYATRLAITDSANAGAVIGRLNAVSTVGSIAGTFLGGFVLISWFGSFTVILGVAACLLVAALLARPRPVLPKAALLGLAAAAAVAGHMYDAHEAEQGRISLETRYNTLRVLEGTLDGRPARFLLTDPGASQSGMYLDAPNELAFAYTRYYALGTALRPGARRVLMLGGGGYSVPKWLLSGGSHLNAGTLELDVVELDPGMTRAARTWFALPDDPRLRVFHEDARMFLNRRAAALAPEEAGPYELIFGDVFNSYYTVPFHVGTRQAARHIHDLLSPDGVFVMNVISALEGDNGRLLRAIYHAFADVFPDVRLIPVHAPGNGTLVQNVMLLALREPLSEAEQAALAGTPAGGLLARRWMRPVPGDVPALTDDFSPVERYTLGFLP